MEEADIYFQFDFKGGETTSTGEFQEGLTRRTIIVEISPEARGNRLEGQSADEVARQLAQNVAEELARQELVDLEKGSGEVVRLDEFPPVLEDVEPDVDETGVRAWLLK
ncbi:MAG: hypothetical protein JO025_12850 [Verrucomicrobia bacterium]|nr:hypothetical protein [Verrucomicrobiota bacterium]